MWIGEIVICTRAFFSTCTCWIVQKILANDNIDNFVMSIVLIFHEKWLKRQRLIIVIDLHAPFSVNFNPKISLMLLRILTILFRTILFEQRISVRKWVCRNETRRNSRNINTFHECILKSIDREGIHSYSCRSNYRPCQEFLRVETNRTLSESKSTLSFDQCIPSSDSRMLQSRCNAWFSFGRRTSQRTISLFMKVNRNRIPEI